MSGSVNTNKFSSNNSYNKSPKLQEHKYLATAIRLLNRADIIAKKPIKSKKVIIQKHSINKKSINIKTKTTRIDHNKVEKNLKENVIKKVVFNSNQELSSLELSYKEIELENEYSVTDKIKKINLSKLEINLDDYSKFNTIENKIQKKNTRISEYIASKSINSEKSENFQKENHVQKLNHSDDLVFFDYDESNPIKNGESQIKSKEKVNQVQVTSQSIKEGVKINPQRLLSTKAKKEKNKKLNFNNIDLSKKIAKNDSVNTQQASFMSNKDQIKRLLKKSDSSENFGCLNKDKMKRTQSQVAFNIQTNSIKNNNKFEKIKNFELKFIDDQNEILQDYGEGSISFSSKVYGEMNTRRIQVSARSHVTTSMDLVIENGKIDVNIPLLERKKFSNIVTSQNANDLGANILVELDQSTEDVEIDVKTKYSKKIFLDEYFRVVNRNDSSYNYILFIGVDVGNTIIYFKRTNNKITNKIINLVDGEIYYEPNFYAEIKNESFKMYEESLLSKCKPILNISANEISSWSYEGSITKKSLNLVEVTNMVYPLGTRKYYELSHLEESVFLGRWNNEYALIPSEEYIQFIMNNFNIGNSAAQCVVQINLSKKAKRINYEGLSSDGIMPIEMSILDEDGTFYTDFSENSEKIFLLGEAQGQININLEYLDGTKEYLQSYCSESTYLIEQL